MKLKILFAILLICSVGFLLISCKDSDKPDQSQNDIFEFLLEEDNTYSISKVNPSAEDKITIPEKYNGLNVTKINGLAFANCSSVKEIVIPDSIVAIGYGAFYGCSALESITLPFVGVKPIPEEDPSFPSHHIGWIFGSSEYSESIKTTPCNSMTTYYLPKSLKRVTVTGDVIHAYAFSDCSYIESIYLTGNIKELETGLFLDCIRLFDINLPDTIESVERRVFTNTGYYNDNRNWNDRLLYIDNILIAAEENIWGECIIKEGTTDLIAGGAFYECENLLSVIIPEGVTKIEESAFYGCSSLSKITIPKSLNSINILAFYKCENLKEVYIFDIEKWLSIECYDSPLEYADKLYLNNEEIKSVEIPNTIFKINEYALSFSTLEQVFVPSSVMYIEPYAFYGATNLKQIYLSEGLKSIGKNAFENCSSLSSIAVPKTVDSIGWNAFENTAIYKKSNFCIDNWLIEGADSYGTYTIPNNITHIADGAFYNCDKISHVIISDSVTHIGKEVFSNCDGLKGVTMSNNLQVIGEQAFFASGLTEIDIPFGVEEIHASAFLHCKDLIKVTIPSSVVYIGEKAFALNDKLSIYCEATSQPTTWDDNWNSSNCPVVWGYSSK